MANQFLRQLFSSDEYHSQCPICLEMYGEMHPETGLVERAVRLPCQHNVGSGCISQWLQTTNTCPICRQVFFPAESDPDTAELELTEIPAHRPPPAQDRTPRGLVLSGPIDRCLLYLREMRRLCDEYCTHLGLESNIARIIVALYSNLLTPGPSNAMLQDCSNNLVIALSIYIGSSLALQPILPEKIAAVIGGVDHSQILRFYGCVKVLPDQKAIVDEGIRSDLRDNFNVEDLYWPDEWDD